MSEYRRILVTTDFSEASEHAIDEAVELSRRFEAELVVLHVNEGALEEASRLLSESHLKDARQLASQAARSELDRIEETRLAGLPRARTVLVETRSAVDAICEWARDNDVDLVVIATHGRTGLDRFLMGSVAERVVRHAPCHVLTVRATRDCC